jgi:hypothetical protein
MPVFYPSESSKLMACRLRGGTEPEHRNDMSTSRKDQNIVALGKVWRFKIAYADDLRDVVHVGPLQHADASITLVAGDSMHLSRNMARWLDCLQELATQWSHCRRRCLTLSSIYVLNK